MRRALGVCAMYLAAGCVSIAGPPTVDEFAVHTYYTNCLRTPLTWSISPADYTIRASAHWVFNANCVRQENGVLAVGGSVVPPTPAAFTVVTSGAAVSPIRGLTAMKAANPPNVRFP